MLQSRTRCRTSRARTDTTPNDRLAGRITGIFGLRGELKCDPTAAGRSVFSPGARLRMRQRGADATVSVTNVRAHKGRLLISLQGIESADDARALVNASLFAPREAFVLGANEFLDEDLIGCALRDPSGNDLGRVASIEHYPGQDLLVVGTARVPLVGAFIKRVDVQGKTIAVELPVGLLDARGADEA